MPRKNDKAPKFPDDMQTFDGRHPRSAARDSVALVGYGLAVFVFLCLITYDPRDPSLNAVTDRTYAVNLCGILGAYIADALLQVLGLCALAVPALLFGLSTRLLMNSATGPTWSETLALLVALCTVAGLSERFWTAEVLNFPTDHPGGTIGTFVHGSLRRFLGSAGEIVILATVLLVSACHIFGITLSGAIHAVKQCITTGGDITVRAVRGLRSRMDARKRRRALQRIREAAYSEMSAKERPPEPAKPVIVEKPVEPPRKPDVDYELPILDTQGDDEAGWDFEYEPFHEPAIPEPPVKIREESPEDKPAPTDRIRAGIVSTLQRMKPRSEPEPKTPKPKPLTQAEMQAAIEEYLRDQQARSNQAAPESSVTGPTESETEPQRAIEVSQRADERSTRARPLKESRSSEDDYRLPPADLLDEPQHSGRTVDRNVLESNGHTLEKKLADLGVKGEVTAIHPGPVITMYELNLAPGIPLRKVLGMSDDLAMALKSGSTRVVAPIPGKDTVGIEVPNLNREVVYFREIVESKAFLGMKEPLRIAIGKGIDGEPFAASLASMPHLLIAGATGTGKSVGLNCLICSWLMSCRPDELKLLLVDPKKLELSYYQDIPHLLHPVVTEAEKVPAVLGWAIREMERRYELLSRTGAKNIESYNRKVTTGQVQIGDGDTEPEKLPYIVIIVDELAELMMVAAKDIEISIARLAQMARASGIHLILATQRPSVDVITGVIKANFPARLSFQVSARADSRTILDTTGAENLLGRGDLLFLPPGTAKMRRLHGAFISENEIKRIADFIKQQREPVYLQEIAKHVHSDESRSGSSELIDDEKYDEAVELVCRLGHASISLIQRHMRIGYNRAARIIEAMEAEGLIGPSDGTSRPREVLAGSLDHIPDGPP